MDYSKTSLKELEKLSRKEYFSKTQEIKHYLALFITKPLLSTNITPNFITILWIILELFSSILMLGPYWYKVIGVLIFNFVVGILDSVDGNLSRIKNLQSSKGIYFEVVGLFLGTPFIFFFLTLGYFITTQNVLIMVIGFLGVIFTIYSKLFILNPKWFPTKKFSQIKKLDLTSPIRKKKGFIPFIASFFRRGQPFNFLLFGIIINQIKLVIIVYSFLFLIQFLHSFFSNYKLAGVIDGN